MHDKHTLQDSIRTHRERIKYSTRTEEEERESVASIAAAYRAEIASVRAEILAHDNARERINSIRAVVSTITSEQCRLNAERLRQALWRT